MASEPGDDDGLASPWQEHSRVPYPITASTIEEAFTYGFMTGWIEKVNP